MIDAVSRLTWIEETHGWRAGPYEIEFAAPQLWVCTRSRRGGDVIVEMTSGSLAALKARVERVEFRRRRAQRALRYMAAFVLAIVVISVAAVIASPLTPLLVVVFSSVGLFSILKAVDCVISRSWESVHLYQ
jgi:hypothetical protein